MKGIIRALIMVGVVAACKPSADPVNHNPEQTMSVQEEMTMRCPQCTEWEKLGMAKEEMYITFVMPIVPLVPYSIKGYIGYSPSYPERYEGQCTDLEIPDLPDGYPFEKADFGKDK